MSDGYEVEDRDIYADDIGSDAYSEYTLYIDCGDAEAKFKAFLATLDSDSYETDWKDRHWK